MSKPREKKPTKPKPGRKPAPKPSGTPKGRTEYAGDRPGEKIVTNTVRG